jgi:hypothetical protein
MKLNSMKPAKSSAISPAPPKCSDVAAISMPIAQPRKPVTCKGMRPTRSVKAIATTMPRISSTEISAAPSAAKMSVRMRSLTLRMWSTPPPNARPRIVGVKMPVP